jgi:hypothetical protein
MATADTPIFTTTLTRPTSISQIRSVFDAFLYASVEGRGVKAPYVGDV